MTIKVFIATSLDGFIARSDGGLDWLPGSSGESNGATPDEDLGYGELMASIDALVMGRNTYDMVRSFGEWPYGNKQVFVLTHRQLEIPDELKPHVRTTQGTPKQLVAQLASMGFDNLYIDGGNLIQEFLRNRLVDELIITTIPILIGSGIPLFGHLDADVKLKLNSVKSYENGLVQSHYHISSGRHEG